MARVKAVDSFFQELLNTNIHTSKNAFSGTLIRPPTTVYTSLLSIRSRNPFVCIFRGYEAVIKHRNLGIVYFKDNMHIGQSEPIPARRQESMKIVI
jgi:hypothetical protein